VLIEVDCANRGQWARRTDKIEGAFDSRSRGLRWFVYNQTPHPTGVRACLTIDRKHLLNRPTAVPHEPGFKTLQMRSASRVVRSTAPSMGRGRVSAETKRRVLRIAKKLGYRPNLAARYLSSRKHITICARASRSSSGNS